MKFSAVLVTAAFALLPSTCGLSATAKKEEYMVGNVSFVPQDVPYPILQLVGPDSKQTNKSTGKRTSATSPPHMFFELKCLECPEKRPKDFRVVVYTSKGKRNAPLGAVVVKLPHSRLGAYNVVGSQYKLYNMNYWPLNLLQPNDQPAIDYRLVMHRRSYNEFEYKKVKVVRYRLGEECYGFRVKKVKKPELEGNQWKSHDLAFPGLVCSKIVDDERTWIHWIRQNEDFPIGVGWDSKGSLVVIAGPEQTITHIKFSQERGFEVVNSGGTGNG